MASGHFGSVPLRIFGATARMAADWSHLEPPEASRKTRIARSTGVAGPVRPVLGQSLGHVNISLCKYGPLNHVNKFDIIISYHFNEK